MPLEFPQGMIEGSPPFRMMGSIKAFFETGAHCCEAAFETCFDLKGLRYEMKWFADARYAIAWGNTAFGKSCWRCGLVAVLAVEGARCLFLA